MTSVLTTIVPEAALVFETNNIPAVHINNAYSRYLEPPRFYHNQSHLVAMLRDVCKLMDYLHDPLAVLLAVLYHDAVYCPSKTDNEKLSANLLRTEMKNCVSAETLDHAEKLILFTINHSIPGRAGYQHGDPKYLDACIFLNADLRILASNEATVSWFEAGIAAEYIPYYGETAYFDRRISVLEKFLNREKIFYDISLGYNDVYNAKAKANLASLISELRLKRELKTYIKNIYDFPHNPWA